MDGKTVENWEGSYWMQVSTKKGPTYWKPLYERKYQGHGIFLN